MALLCEKPAFPPQLEESPRRLGPDVISELLRQHPVCVFLARITLSSEVAQRTASKFGSLGHRRRLQAENAKKPRHYWRLAIFR